MTRLEKPVSRATRGEYSVLYAKRRAVVVTLLPGDVIEFRELGRRGRWLLAVDTAFRYAIRCKVFSDMRERQIKRRKKKGAA
jgi:hypothetical protein